MHLINAPAQLAPPPPSFFLIAGTYGYTRELLALSRAGHGGPKATAHPRLRRISSPLTAHLARWQQALSGHPDRAFVQFVLQGLEHGFRVGFTASTPLLPAPGNMHSARTHPEVIDEYLSTELAEGRMLGPFSPGQILVSRVIRILRAHIRGARKLGARARKRGEGEKYVWCKRTGFCALTPECWRHQSDCS